MSTIEIGRRLKKARLDAGLTQNDAATQLGITYQAISNYERGKNRVDTDTLTNLCRIYNIHISDVLGVSSPSSQSSEESYDDRFEKVSPNNEAETNAKKNIIRLAGRDGSYEERCLSDEQLSMLKSLIDQLPKLSEDI